MPPVQENRQENYSDEQKKNVTTVKSNDLYELALIGFFCTAR